MATLEEAQEIAAARGWTVEAWDVSCFKFKYGSVEAILPAYLDADAIAASLDMMVTV